ncbi:related to allantoate permease [Cephalotrichum gorgonifer]|uniref:Related to allantoate permease n=1 Tax=Cephalotrichum gorgonifer TaxID=2041049 RepID=A0AAE8SSY1_9PEZI|nr:related to allantoate permease [Cephalotrichum gorgonifer]
MSRPNSSQSVQDEGKPKQDWLEMVASNNEGGIVIDEATNKRIVRKIDWQLMPILCFTYALQYYDKLVLSHAAVFGLRDDLNLQSGLRYSWVGLIFYFGHMVGMYPCSLLAQRFRPKRVCSLLTIVWGTIVLLTPTCTSFSGLLANRFFLGLVESGISPIFMLIVGMWYTQKETSLRSSVWYSCSGGSMLISPLISFGIAHINGHPWKYMFIVAGAITFAWGILLLWIFPDMPQNAKGWSEEDRVILLERIKRDNMGGEHPQFKIHQALEAVCDYQFWALFLLAVCSTTGAAIMTIFSSVVFSGMGFDPYISLLLNLPNGAIAFITVLGSGWLGGTKFGRLNTMALSCLPVILGCCLLWQLPNSMRGGRIVGLYLINFFGSAWIQCVALGTSNVAGYTKKGTYAAGVWIGYCAGNIMGPLLFSAKYAPRYDESFAGILVCFVVLVVMALALRVMLSRRNKKRDEKYGEPRSQNGLDDMTDKENKSFRWMTGATRERP